MYVTHFRSDVGLQLAIRKMLTPSRVPTCTRSSPQLQKVLGTESNTGLVRFRSQSSLEPADAPEPAGRPTHDPLSVSKRGRKMCHFLELFNAR